MRIFVDGLPKSKNRQRKRWRFKHDWLRGQDFVALRDVQILFFNKKNLLGIAEQNFGCGGRILSRF
ncbi:MAG: hypothetical protein RR859_06930, partial [Ruthenibacterium sp.]